MRKTPFGRFFLRKNSYGATENLFCRLSVLHIFPAFKAGMSCLDAEGVSLRSFTYDTS